MSWVDEYHVKLIALEQDRDRWKNLCHKMWVSMIKANIPLGWDGTSAAREYLEVFNADRGHA